MFCSIEMKSIDLQLKYCDYKQNYYLYQLQLYKTRRPNYHNQVSI